MQTAWGAAAQVQAEGEHQDAPTSSPKGAGQGPSPLPRARGPFPWAEALEPRLFLSAAQGLRALEGDRAFGNLSSLEVGTGVSPQGAAASQAGLAAAPGAAAQAADHGVMLLAAGPAAPSLVDLLPGSDSGRFEDDNITSCRQAGVLIRADEPGTEGVRVYCGGQLAGEASPAGGIWTYTFAPDQLAEGGNTITARAWNSFGESGDSPPLYVMIDTLAPALVTAGSLDPTFGTGGKVMVAVGTGHDYPGGVAVRSSGRVVVAGSTDMGDSMDFALLCYNADGTPDNSFGTEGKVLTAFGTLDQDEEAFAVAIQNDGRIVAAGYAEVGPYRCFALARYDSDGTLDEDFGGDGKVITSIGGDAGATCMAIQGDGKIVVAGSAYVGGLNQFAVARYNADGTLDGSFGTGGKVITSVGAYYAYCFSVAIHGDRKIILAGCARMSRTGREDFALVRYNVNGSLDASFGEEGIVLTPVAEREDRNDRAYCVAVQGDGRILAAGWTDVYHDQIALVRYHADGTLDQSFGAKGKVFTLVGLGSRGSGRSMAIQDDGKIVVAGTSAGSVAVVRYNANGTLDSGFGAGGKVTTGVGPNGDWVCAMALQADGKIVVAGEAYDDEGKSDFGLVRYMGQPDPGLDLDAASDTGPSDIDDVTSDSTPTFLISSGPYFRVYRDGQIISRAYETGGTFTTSSLPDGTHAFRMSLVDEAGNESPLSEELPVTIDTAPPRFTGLAVQQADGGIVLTLSEPMALEKGDLALFDSNESPVDLADAVLEHQSDPNIAALRFARRPEPGYYTLVVRGDSGVQDLAGNRLDGNGDGTGGDDYTAQFMVAVPGDADLDGQVGRADLLAMKGAFGENTSTWVAGDFNGDGRADVLDYIALKQNWGRHVEPASLAAGQAGDTAPLRAAEDGTASCPPTEAVASLPADGIVAPPLQAAGPPAEAASEALPDPDLPHLPGPPPAGVMKRPRRHPAAVLPSPVLASGRSTVARVPGPGPVALPAWRTPAVPVAVRAIRRSDQAGELSREAPWHWADGRPASDSGSLEGPAEVLDVLATAVRRRLLLPRI